MNDTIEKRDARIKFILFIELLQISPLNMIYAGDCQGLHTFSI
jgi:hypothetical protein